MVDYYENELGMLDMSNMGNISLAPNGGGSKSQQIKAFVGNLHKIANETKNNIFSVNQLKFFYDVSCKLQLQLCELFFFGFVSSN